jgi:hypothetical protein
MFMSPQTIIFLELVYNWLRMDFKELKNYATLIYLLEFHG